MTHNDHYVTNRSNLYLQFISRTCELKVKLTLIPLRLNSMVKRLMGTVRSYASTFEWNH